MIHAIIVDEPRPDPSRVRPADTLAECVQHLSAADREYFQSRAVQESEAARDASCSEARVAHEELAKAYGQLCSSIEGRADQHLASDLAMFRFNSKPVD
jgi:hypothetical protein